MEGATAADAESNTVPTTKSNPLVRLLAWIGGKILSRPHLLGWLINLLLVFVVCLLLGESYLDEKSKNQYVATNMHAASVAIFSGPKSASWSRTQQTSELGYQFYKSWPLVIKGSPAAHLLAVRNQGPLADDYRDLDNIWQDVRNRLESDIPAQAAVRLVDQETRKWIAKNTFYGGREPLFAVWLGLVVVYALFVLIYIMPRSRRMGRTESLLLLVDAGLYFTVLSWFTKAEIPGLGWIIVFPVAVIFFEMYKASYYKTDVSATIAAGLLFLFFLFFGMLQLRVDYVGPLLVVDAAALALKDFLINVGVGALGAAFIMALFHYSDPPSPPSGDPA